MTIHEYIDSWLHYMEIVAPSGLGVCNRRYLTYTAYHVFSACMQSTKQTRVWFGVFRVGKAN